LNRSRAPEPTLIVPPSRMAAAGIFAYFLLPLSP